jgi:hypothetical protein
MAELAEIFSFEPVDLAARAQFPVTWAFQA